MIGLPQTRSGRVLVWVGILAVLAAVAVGLTYTPLEGTLERTLRWYAERGLVPPSRRANPRT